MMNLQKNIRRVLKEELNESAFFRRRVPLQKVENLLRDYTPQVFYETKSYDQFKYELTLKAVEWIMWDEYKMGWEDLPEQEEIEFDNEVSNMFNKTIKKLYNSYSERISREESNPKQDLYYEFKCTDADEDGIFYDTCFGEIDSTEFAQFIDDMENYEISEEEFKDKFTLTKSINKIINNPESEEWLEFYDKSEEDGYVVIFDGDIHYIYSV